MSRSSFSVSVCSNPLGAQRWQQARVGSAKFTRIPLEGSTFRHPSATNEEKRRNLLAQDEISLKSKICLHRFVQDSQCRGRMLSGVTRNDQRIAAMLLVGETWKYRNNQHSKEKTQQQPQQAPMPTSLKGPTMPTTNKDLSCVPVILTPKVLNAVLVDVNALMTSTIWDEAAAKLGPRLASVANATPKNHPYLYTIKQIQKLALFSMRME